jgi:hypothetical protein
MQLQSVVAGLVEIHQSQVMVQTLLFQALESLL